MTDPVKLVTEPLPPVAVTIIGTGDGQVVPATGTIATTPGPSQPNLIVTVVQPLAAIAIRFGNTFCVSFVGSLSVGGVTTKILPHADFVSLVQSAVILAACIAGLGAIKDFGTVFSGLEKRWPLASGSV